MSFADYHVINVRTHVNRIHPAFSLASKFLPSLGMRLCSGTINNNSDMKTHITQSSHTINEGMMDIPVPETLILEIHTRIVVPTIAIVT